MSTEIASLTRVKLDLFFLSFLSLFVELLAIRWLSADIRAFTVFHTFPLVACFIGLGIGLAKPTDRLFPFAPTMLALLIVLIRIAEATGISNWMFPSIAVFQWQNPDAQLSLAAIVAVIAMALLQLLPAFVCCMAIGTKLGRLFESLPPLTAYATNLAGALCGSIAFSAVSFWGLNPLYIAILAILALSFYLERKQLWIYAMIPLVVAVSTYFAIKPAEVPLLVPDGERYADGPSQTYWSPYQRIDLRTFSGSSEEHPVKSFFGLELAVNHFFHQYMLLPNADTITGNAEIGKWIKKIKAEYALPFLLKPAENVLIVGAGTGQNVSVGASLGPSRFDAVEIDPTILKLGKKYNPFYSESRVNLICADARQFMVNAHGQYDLIVYGYLDSQSVVGEGSSVRIDNYIYTQESFANALELLHPNGLICVMFSVEVPWIGERIYKTIEAAAGYPPLVVKAKDEAPYWTFIVGKPVQDGTLQLPEGYTATELHPNAETRILTDDWPYLYVSPKLVDIPYLVMCGIVLAGALLGGRKMLLTGKRRDWQMLLLGAAFLLLELHGISLLALVYGSTWVVSAIVINCILLLSLFGTLVTMKAPRLASNLHLMYGMLFVSLLASYLITPQIIAHIVPESLRAVAATVITIVPFAFTGLVFAASFKGVPSAPRALAFNLFGAVLGAFLEYLSNYFGIRSLQLVALGLYIASFIVIAAGDRDDT